MLRIELDAHKAQQPGKATYEDSPAAASRRAEKTVADGVSMASDHRRQHLGRWEESKDTGSNMAAASTAAWETLHWQHSEQWSRPNDRR